MRYCVRRQAATALLSIGHRFLITDEAGAPRYRVTDRLQSTAPTAMLRDAQGRLVLTIERWTLTLGLGYYVMREGQVAAVVQVQRDLTTEGPELQLRAHGEDLEVVGDRARHEYLLTQRERVVAAVSRRWCRARGRRAYGVDIVEGLDEPVLLACVVALDMLFQYP